MMKRLVAGVTALSLTLASAAPVDANGLDREDVGKLLFGLVAIAAVSAAIENNQRRENENAATQAHSTPRNGSWADLNRYSREATRSEVVELSIAGLVEAGSFDPAVAPGSAPPAGGPCAPGDLRKPPGSQDLDQPQQHLCHPRR